MLERENNDRRSSTATLTCSKRLHEEGTTVSFAPGTAKERRSGGDFLAFLNTLGPLLSPSAAPAAGPGGDPGGFSSVEV